jgi:predicted hotdog family 3-hydroxylacyl-ACP dehydratase
VRKEPLREILELSEVLENLRAFDQKVKEPCGSCSKMTDCYGCRGAAYQLTGDYLTGDQMCWKAEDVAIESLPVGVTGLVPHGKTMRMIDQLVQIGERETQTTFTVTKECVLVDSSGRLDELAFVEMIAQSFAASHGFHLSPEERRIHRGLLLGAKDLVVSGEARLGDQLTVHLRKVTRFGAFGVVEGAIYRQDGKLVATGQIKIWRPSDSELEEMVG